MYSHLFLHCLTPIIVYTQFFDIAQHWSLCTLNCFDITKHRSLCTLIFLTPPDTDHYVYSHFWHHLTLIILSTLFFFFSLSNSNCYIHSQVWPYLILIIMLTQSLTLPNTDRYVHSHFWHHLTCIIMYTHILYTAQYWSLCPLTFLTLPMTYQYVHWFSFILANNKHYVHPHFWHCLVLIMYKYIFDTV